MDARYTLIEHLDELRKRIILSLVSLSITTAASLPFSFQILKILKSPAGAYIQRLAFFRPQDAFLVYMKAAFICGFILSLPVILYQAWSFFSPALDKRFKKYVFYFVGFGSLVFVAGALFAYFIVLPRAIAFLLSFAVDILKPVISAKEYISFVVSIILGCGFIFQMPVFSFILTKSGLVNARFLRKKAKWAILIIFIVAAAITPTTDAFNMLVFALPMLILYEISIWVSKLAKLK